MDIKKSFQWCLGVLLYLFAVLAISQLPASHHNQAPKPFSWPSNTLAPDAPALAGHWQGTWGGEAAVLQRQSIDMRLVVDTERVGEEVYLSLAPHPARSQHISDARYPAEFAKSGNVMTIADTVGGHYRFERKGDNVQGRYQSNNGDISELTLFPMQNDGVVQPLFGDRGDVTFSLDLLDLGNVTLDDFGNYLLFAVFWDTLFQGVIYFGVGGLCAVFFYRIMRKRWAWRKIQSRWPDWRQYRHELVYSALTLVVFGLSGGLFLYDSYSSITLMYSHVGMYGWGYFCFSVVVIFLLHDTYFYWGHRMMHIPVLYPYFHKGHHRSVAPTPWSTWAFMPLEAVVQTAFVPLVVFILPLHYSVIVVFYAGMFLRSLVGHTGFEVYPRFVVTNKWFRWIATVSHHDMHHRYFHYNYALYFTWWDRWMGTLHPEYQQKVEEVHDRKEKLVNQ